MVLFKRTMGGYEVIVNNKHFGWVSKEHGFFTDPTVIKEFVTVTAEDLREIASKVEEIKKS